MSRDKKVNVHFSQPNRLKSLSQRLTPLIIKPRDQREMLNLWLHRLLSATSRRTITL